MHSVPGGTFFHVLCVLCIACLAGQPANAHKPSDSYLTLDLTQATPQLRWDVALRDLQLGVGLDDGDGRLTWHEVVSRSADIGNFAASHLTLRAAHRECRLLETRLQLADHADGTYGVLTSAVDCAGRAPDQLEYRLLSDIDPTHRGLLRTLTSAGEQLTVLSPDSPSVTFGDDRLPVQDTPFFSRVNDGIRHIASGFDHLLFLCTLMLPTVLVRSNGQWHGVDGFRATVWRVAAIVTAFTIAHSFTLAMTAFDIISLPGRWVESAIALTLIISALHNLRPFIPLRPATLAFALGLIHGVGFASALGDSGADTSSLLVHLLGFNLGVELGQLVVVLVFLPIAFWVRHSVLYRRLGLQTGSAAIAAIGAVWFVERSLDVSLITL